MNPASLFELNMEEIKVETQKIAPTKSNGNFDEDAKGEESKDLKLDLNKPMPELLEVLTQYPVKTRVSMTGPMIVARDIAHARLAGRLEKTGELPDYFKKYPVYYAGPAKTPEGMPSGSFGPTTSGRMDPYVEQFQAVGGSMIMIGKGNRTVSRVVWRAVLTSNESKG